MKLSRCILPGLLVLFSASTVKACDGGNLAMAYLFGYNNYSMRAGVFNNYTPPYFALHPPVYYGDRYYRPYGASPFAAWPQLQPNASYAPRLGLGVPSSATLMDNPHCPTVQPITPENVPAKMPDVVQNYSGPLVIENPFYVETQSRLTSISIQD